MNAGVILAVFGAMALTLSVFLFRRARASSSSAKYWSDCTCTKEEEILALSLCGGIFNCADSEVVAAETTRKFARVFDEERKILALDWLNLARRSTRSMLSEHRLATRANPETTATGELKLIWNYLMFEATTSGLWLLVMLRGPAHARKALERCLGIAERLRLTILVTNPTVEIVRD